MYLDPLSAKTVRKEVQFQYSRLITFGFHNAFIQKIQVAGKIKCLIQISIPGKRR